MAATAFPAEAWRIAVVRRAAVGCFYPGAIATALAFAAAIAARLAEEAPHLPTFA